MVRSLVVVLFLLLSGSFASGMQLERARKLTNAARFQAGLPPLPPNKREVGMKPRGTSVSNQCPGKTYISIKKNGQPLGHLGKLVSATTGQFDVITTSPNAGQYLEVSTTFDSAAHDIKLVNTNSTYKYLGVADPTTGSIEQLSFAYLVASNQTLAGSKPIPIGNSRTSTLNPNSLSESAVWVVTATKSFYPIFVNNDGSKVGAQAVIKQVDSTAGQSGWAIGLVGDWEVFSQSPAGLGWLKVDFYLECGW